MKDILDKFIDKEKINESEEIKLREKIGKMIKGQILEAIKTGNKSKLQS